MFSSVNTASLVTHYQAELVESLISFMYYTAFVASTKQLGPAFSGPKDHNLVPACSFSHPKFSFRYLALVLGSSLAVILFNSTSSANPSSN
jgi:hypothetical protein